jgi:hypothetical protein
MIGALNGVFLATDGLLFYKQYVTVLCRSVRIASPNGKETIST